MMIDASTKRTGRSAHTERVDHAGRTARTTRRARLHPLLGAVICGLALAFATGANCRTQATNADVTLVEGEGCGPVLNLIESVSVEAWSESGGAPCMLEDRCVNLSERFGTLAEIEDELAAASQPLVDVDKDDAVQIVILGYSQPSCLAMDESPLMCGSTEIAELDPTTGVVDITLDCRGLVDRCAAFASIPACDE